MNKDKFAAPLPRDHDAASFSEVVPISSKNIKMLKSPLLLAGLLLAIVTVVTFGLFQSMVSSQNVKQQYELFVAFTFMVTAVMLAMLLWAIWIYGKTDRGALYVVFPLLLTFLLMTPASLKIWFWVFRELLPGNIAKLKDAGVAQTFVGYLFGAGMMEELLKAVPALIGFGLTMRAQKVSGAMPGRLYNLLRVRGPLDGMLMGLAAGAMFILVETAGEYVHNLVVKIATSAPEGKATTDSLFAGIGAGLILLFPRTLGGISGHMGYSAIFGYFIGLAVLRRSHAPLLIIIGFLLASLLHATWNTGDKIHGLTHIVIAITTFLIFLACLLKARHIEASLFGRNAAHAGSIVVGQRGGGMPAAAPPAMAMPTQRPPNAAQPAATIPAAERGFGINFGAVRVRIPDSGPLNFAQVPGAAGLAAEIVRHPKNPEIIGLKNAGTTDWTVGLADGTMQNVGAGRTLRIAAQTRIDFGNGLSGSIDYR